MPADRDRHHAGLLMEAAAWARAQPLIFVVVLRGAGRILGHCERGQLALRQDGLAVLRCLDLNPCCDHRVCLAKGVQRRRGYGLRSIRYSLRPCDATSGTTVPS
eukprot:1110229-Rhodomonas_salina.2